MCFLNSVKALGTRCNELTPGLARQQKNERSHTDVHDDLHVKIIHKPDFLNCKERKSLIRVMPFSCAYRMQTRLNLSPHEAVFGCCVGRGF